MSNSLWVAGAVFNSRLKPDWWISAAGSLPLPSQMLLPAHDTVWTVQIKFSVAYVKAGIERVDVAWGKTEGLRISGEKAFARSGAHTSCQGLCWPAPVKILHLGQQLPLELPSDYIYSNPQSFPKPICFLHGPNSPVERGRDHYPCFFQAINGSTNLCNSPEGYRIAFRLLPWERWGILGASAWLQPWLHGSALPAATCIYSNYTTRTWENTG